jgi:alpha-ketoglutarate-dependent taurine dioxygenase
LHGELYYGTQVPDILWFHCERPSPGGGQTTVGDGYELFARLTPETQSYFREHAIRYMRRLEDGTWQKAFMTADLDEVRRVCAANDTTMRIDEEDGAVLTDYVCSALRSDRRPGATAFINNVLPIFYGEKAIESGWVERELGESIKRAPIVVRDEHGERLDAALVDDLRRAAEAVTHEIDWAAGDLAMVDNTWVLHGRRQAEGEGRSVLVRMGSSSFPLA